MAGETYWGVDIGGSAVKAVKLRRTDDKLEVVAADIVPLKGSPTQEISFGRDRRIWIALGELAKRNHIHSESLVASIPAKATFIRPFEIVLVTGKPVQELVTFEAQQHLPFGLDTVIWDYELFPAEADAKQRQGVMFAVKKEVVNNYMTSISAGHLAADDLQLAPLALCNFVRYDRRPEGTVLLLDVGATSTDLVLIHNDRYTVTSVPAGGDLITRAVQEKFKIGAEQAERVKRNVARLKMAKEALEAMLPAIRKVVSEIEGAARRLRAEAGEVRFQKALLFGGAAETPGLAKMLSQSLDCEVDRPVDLLTLPVGEGVDRAPLEAHFSELAVAVGLALQAAGEAASHVSLIARAAARRKFAFRSMPYAIAVLGVVAATLLWLGAFGEWQAGKLHFAQVALGKLVDPIDALRKQWETLGLPSSAKQMLDKYADFGENRLCWIKVPDHISKNLFPRANRDAGRDLDKVWIVSLSLEKKGGLLRGTSWWAIKTRKNANLDLAFAEKAVLRPLARLPGFGHADMSLRNASLRYSDSLIPDAPPKVGGQYVVFPVTFDVDISRMEKGK